MTDRTRTSRTWLRAGAGAVLAGVMLAGCSSGDDSATSSSTTAPSATAPSTTVAPSSMRGKRYCEVLLVRPADGKLSAEVYNSYPLNDCPEAKWAALDAKTIAAAEGVPVAVLNGPRFWLMDRVKKAGGTADLPKKDFGGIEMYRQASVEVASMADAMMPYRPNSVDRKAVFTYDAGQTVYELTSEDGTKYVMQSWSQQKDPSLVESGLAGLGSRLQLPAGWTYTARTLDEPLTVDTTSQTATVVQDDLGNSYSQETSSSVTPARMLRSAHPALS